MRIQLSFVCPPIPSRNFDWSAIDSDTYDAELHDGEPKGGPRGFGATPQAAIDDLMEQLGAKP